MINPYVDLSDEEITDEVAGTIASRHLQLGGNSASYCETAARSGDSCVAGTEPSVTGTGTQPSVFDDTDLSNPYVTDSQSESLDDLPADGISHDTTPLPGDFHIMAKP